MIITREQKQEYYEALVKKDSTYDGIFFAGIKTTGIFCHPTCTARKPKFENCQFYLTAEEALLAGFRPCKICHPMSFPHDIPEEVKQLVTAVEEHPEKRWQESDFRELGLHSATARRKFKTVYGMTFVQYARSRRMGLAFKEIANGSKVIDQQVATGYESASGFNDAFTKIMGNPAKKTAIKVLNANFISTPIGQMMSLSDEEYIYLLEFADRRGLEREIERLRLKLNARIIPGQNKTNELLEQQLIEYFKKERVTFDVPLFKMGTPFQKKVWEILEEIPKGDVWSYKDIAEKLGDKNKVRAVGNANGANQLAIIIPCHRVIKTNGELGGYGGGLERKKYLLALEK
ncbi:trifunctional transcriptional activator/DNA repair protein Ada/methylated-DNA--[protein]-cysteine S-methyltransferase [Vagococcus carniphilus]|uniref:bifunctional transcriptional activator/DNA repair enzyme AdaA n=1 Tax=Vagococcus carniphilus TaxID=218144 RepID=UPI002891224D|nr:trifunctional transcriptional activator/DNA repair protein Ada/methylated-DNA--[protein]-cysteine S-methyltransferase [Vagococcus carniphilus]MDT2848914.1 trifunctional transcriptional activator/DNA repair protein Ada/methylated-DNA--[protein]-cysteine S-methyltransferase [Vagococcus carniphilus]